MGSFGDWGGGSLIGGPGDSVGGTTGGMGSGASPPSEVNGRERLGSLHAVLVTAMMPPETRGGARRMPSCDLCHMEKNQARLAFDLLSRREVLEDASG